jgi:hypothetical protein
MRKVACNNKSDNIVCGKVFRCRDKNRIMCRWCSMDNRPNRKPKGTK